jgi:hypothetical protein
MMPKLPVLSEAGMLQRGVRGVGYSNVFRTFVEEQLHEKDFREHAYQVCAYQITCIFLEEGVLLHGLSEQKFIASYAILKLVYSQ